MNSKVTSHIRMIILEKSSMFVLTETEKQSIKMKIQKKNKINEKVHLICVLTVQHIKSFSEGF